MSTENLLEQVDFVPFFSAEAPDPLLPATPGELIFTEDGRIYVGMEDGTWAHYGLFIVVPSMNRLNTMPKETSKLYCVSNVLYRWDGTKLIPLSGTLQCDITGTGTLAEELKATALANPTVRVLSGIIRSDVTEAPEGFSSPCFYLFSHLAEAPSMVAGTCLMISSRRRIWSGYTENICAADPEFEWTEITMPSGEYLLLQAPRIAGEAPGTLELKTFLRTNVVPPPTEDFHAGGRKITNVATPTDENDVATKIYVDDADTAIIESVDALTERVDDLETDFNEHLEDEEAHKPLFDAKQDKITATGTSNLLTAPSSVGGQPGTKAISDLLASPEAQTANTQLLVAPEAKGAAPTLKPINDFATAEQGVKADTAVQPPDLEIYAKDAEVVKLTGDQTIAGTKTFSASPLVPNKTTAAVNDGTLVATEAQVFAVNTLASNLEFVKHVSYNDTSGDVTFTFRNNSTLTVNVFAENLAQDIGYDSTSKELVITKRDGTQQRISIADLIDIYTGTNGTHIQVTVGANNVISAVLKAGTVSEAELTTALLAKINTVDSKQDKLNRTVGGNDNASGTVTDTGENLSIPIPVTVVAPAASATQITAGTRTLRATLKILIDNIANLFSRVGTAETNINGKQNNVTGKTINNALQKITTDSQGHVTTSTAVVAGDLPSHTHAWSQIDNPPSIPAAPAEATRTTLGLVKATSPDGTGTTTLGTSGVENNRALSFNMMGNTARDFNDYRTPGEWFFYTVSNTNQPPFLAGSTGIYLKVLMGYSTTNCIQLCWRRGSSEMWTRHSTSATAWTAWTRFATTADIPTLTSLGGAPANIALTAETGTGTDTTTPAVASGTIQTVVQTVWAKIRQLANVIATKANIASPTFTGTVKIPNKTTVAINDGTLVATEAQVFAAKSSMDNALPVAIQALEPGQTGTPNIVTILYTGRYRITARGAAGIASDSRNRPANAGYVGGKGAEIAAEFNLKAGDILTIVVGKMGTRTDATTAPADGTGGGGGGGTFVFKNIPAITDSRYQYTKDGQSFEVLLVAAGGGGTTDLNYSTSPANGSNGIGATWYSPTSYQAPSTTTFNGTSSTSQATGGSIQQYITNNAIGNYYSRSNTMRGGYGGGAVADDARSSGGGWFCSTTDAYSWSAGENTTGITGANDTGGAVLIGLADSNGVSLANLSGQPTPTFGQAANSGSATTAARSDHSHALPENPLPSTSGTTQANQFLIRNANNNAWTFTSGGNARQVPARNSGNNGIEWIDVARPIFTPVYNGIANGDLSEGAIRIRTNVPVTNISNYQYTLLELKLFASSYTGLTTTFASFAQTSNGQTYFSQNEVGSSTLKVLMAYHENNTLTFLAQTSDGWNYGVLHALVQTVAGSSVSSLQFNNPNQITGIDVLTSAQLATLNPSGQPGYKTASRKQATLS